MGGAACAVYACRGLSSHDPFWISTLFDHNSWMCCIHGYGPFETLRYLLGSSSSSLIIHPTLNFDVKMIYRAIFRPKFSYLSNKVCDGYTPYTSKRGNGKSFTLEMLWRILFSTYIFNPKTLRAFFFIESESIGIKYIITYS